MFKRKSPARRMRKKKTKPYSKVIYYIVDNYMRKVHTRVRVFNSYDEAILHLTNIKLGFTVEEDAKWKRWTPHKLVWGHLKNGKEVHEGTTILNEKPEFPNERASVGRSNISSGLLRQWGKSSFPIPESLAGARYIQPYVSWSGRSATGSGTVAKLDDLNWFAADLSDIEPRVTASYCI